jgi:hypothetical protein
MRKIILMFACVFILHETALAQTYYLNGYAGVGYARFLTDMDLPGLNQNGFNSKIRLMWQPEHRLRVGLESGYHYLYHYDSGIVTTDFGSTDAKSSLTAIPIFFVAAMEIMPQIEILGGIGPTILHTYFKSFGYETESKQMSTSYFVAGRYEYPLNESVSIGGELNFYRINKIEDSTLSLQFVLGYRLLSW